VVEPTHLQKMLVNVDPRVRAETWNRNETTTLKQAFLNR